MELDSYDSFRGEGMSAGLARGIIASHGGADVTGEGMGVGAVAMRSAGFTYFAGRAVTKKSRGKIVKRFLMDRRLLWTFMGRPSVFFTKLGDMTTSIYKSAPAAQKFFLRPGLVVLIKKILGFGVIFQKVEPAASAVCEYVIKKRSVAVNCRIKASGAHDAKFYLMNELSADFFRTAEIDNRAVAAPSGWEEIGESEKVPWFYNPEKGVGFSVTGPVSGGRSACRLYWGREKADGLSWAGFEYELDAGNNSGGSAVNYTLFFREKGELA